MSYNPYQPNPYMTTGYYNPYQSLGLGQSYNPLMQTQAQPSPMPTGPNIPGRGFNPINQWNDPTRAAVDAWNKAHPGWIADGSQIGFKADPAFATPPTPPPTTPPPTTPTPGPGGGPPGESYTDMITRLIGAMPINAGGYSDDLNRTWMTVQQQQGAAALQAATQIQLQNQTNALRMTELMGGQRQADGTMQSTDAAQRWRSELESQQNVQNERLRQEYSQMLGYTVDANGNPTTTQTLAGRAQSETEAARLAANQAQMAELLGYRIDPNTGQPITSAPTMALQRLRQESDLAKEQRELQERMQAAGFGQESKMQTAQFGFQGQESAYERALREKMQGAGFTHEMAMQQGQQGWQTGESALDRAARLQLQQEQQGWQTGERVGTQEWQSGESLQERNLRERLQAGQLNQQEAEFARTYILQQQEGRRQEAQLSGYLDNGQLTEAGRAARAAEAARIAELSGQIGPDGQLTEAARAARESEKTQRASLAAQLLNAPKDVFRAGAFFRSLNGGNQAGMGFGGGGISGFNSLGNRMQGTGGTLNPDDVYGALGYGGATMPGGQAMSSWLNAPQAQATTPGVPAVPTNPSGANSPAGTPAANLSDLWGESGTPDSAANNAVDEAMAPSAEETPGDEPGGPVGDDTSSMVAAGLGDLGLGMNAGGNFPGRVPPDQQGLPSQPTAPIPYIDQSTLQDPEIKAMFDDMRQQGLREAAAAKQGKRNGKKASKTDGAEGDLTHMTDKLASGHAASNERYLRGLSRLAQKGALPGMGPAGPVDAPLYPTDGGSSPMPTLQDTGSLGGSSFAAPAAPPMGGGTAALGLSPYAPPSTFGSIDPYQQAAAQNTMNNVLMGGIGNLGPQELEKMSKTQRGLAEGAAGAAGINWDDLEDAYANTRFANTGNALLA